jgi:hypothetical protein
MTYARTILNDVAATWTVHPQARCYRVTFLTSTGERLQHYFSTGGFSDPRKLKMTKEEAAQYTESANADLGPITVIRVIRQWKAEQDARARWSR